MSPYFYKCNYNPWKKRIGDCAIRSVSAALNMSYIEVCKAFHVAWKNGYGLIRDTGIDLDDIKQTFDEYFDSVTDFNEDLPKDAKMQAMDDEMTKFDADNGIDSASSGITVNEFIDMHRGEGLFLVGCVTPDHDRDGHIVYVNTNAPRFIDTFDCGDFVVDAWLHVKRRLTKGDPRCIKISADRHIIP